MACYDGTDMTAEQKRLSRKYLLYRLLANFWFVSAVWLYLFYKKRDTQISIQ